MDAVSLLIVVLIIVFLIGGFGYPHPADGPAPINAALYIVAVVLVIVLLVKLIGVLV
jgi:hypothetical protein